MGLRLETAPGPATDIVSLDEAKAHLGVDTDEWDGYLGGLIAAAVASIDGAEGWLGRALSSQTWNLDLPRFSERIALPLPPLTSVGAITYRDPDGSTQTLSADIYEVGGVGAPSGGWIARKVAACWPATVCRDDAVTVQFTAGYADVPAPIKQALLLLIGHWFMSRETVNVGNVTSELPFSTAALLSPYRHMGAL